jgi:hypothetical protein
LTIKVTKDRMREAEAAIRAIGAKRVLVGVPESEDARKPDENGKMPAIGNAALAYIHNNGAPEANIPARPFMEPGLKIAQPKIEALMLDAGKNLFDLPIWVTLNQVGLEARSAIKIKINDGPFVPLAKSTIAARKRKGIESEDPLKRTLEMLNSISYVIVDT